MNLLFKCALFTCAYSTVLFATKWDGEYWQELYLKNWERGKFRCYTTSVVRLYHAFSTPYYYRFTENLAYQILPYLDLEAHYSFIYNKPQGALKFSTVSRFEFEINPLRRFESGITLKWRNRLEILKLQHVSQVQYRFRHRFLAYFPVKNRGVFTGFICSDEVFYNFTLDRFTENRFIPLSAELSLNSRVSLSPYFMIRNVYSSNKWYKSFVLGSELKY